MSITYSGGVITLNSEGTEASPATFEDIYDASVAGGWGVVSMSSDKNAFVINAHLLVNTGSYLKDTKKYLNFTMSEQYIKAVGTGVLQLGEKDDSTGKTYNGCILVVEDSSIGSYKFGNLGSGTVRLFDCGIKYNCFFGFYTTSGQTATVQIDGCKIWDWFGGRFQGVDSYIKNSEFHNATSHAITLRGVLGELSNVKSIDGKYGFYHHGTLGGDATANGMTFINCTTAEFLYATGGTAILRCIDFVVDRADWRIAWTGSVSTNFLYREYTFDPIIQDSNGSILEDHTVIIKDNADTEVLNDTIGSDGKLTNSGQPILYGTYRRLDGNTMTAKGPHTLEIYDGVELLMSSPIDIDRPLLDNRLIINLGTSSYTLDDVYAGLEVINRNVKKTSLSIPASEDLE